MTFAMLVSISPAISLSEKLLKCLRLELEQRIEPGFDRGPLLSQ